MSVKGSVRRARVTKNVADALGARRQPVRLGDGQHVALAQESREFFHAVRGQFGGQCGRVAAAVSSA